METFRQWAFSLIISGIAGTLVSLLSPRGNMEKALRTVIGIFIVSVLCSPLTKLETDADFIGFSVEQNEPAMAHSLGRQMEDSCRKTIGIAVKDVASEVGINDFEIETDLYIDDNCCIIIQDIHIVIPSENKASANEFSDKLQKKLGVPVTVECK